MRMRSLTWYTIAAFGVTRMDICGTSEPTEEQMQLARHLQVREMTARYNGASFANATGININLYYHIIAASTSKADGYIDALAITNQTKALNDAFGPHNISWTQAGANWTVAPQWSRNQNETTMKRALRKGTYADLNVYIFPSIDYHRQRELPKWNTVLGVADLLPMEVTPQSEDWYGDGILIRSDTLPGSTSTYNLGMTLVHEIGHWLGLYHTFEGSCTGRLGDGIDDTPSESKYYSGTGVRGCHIGRDSCPGPGPDPVTNYMDYSDENCYTEFTHGQEIRMYSQWAEYRAPHRTP